MSIPKSFVVDIGGRGEVLRFESMLRELKRVEKKKWRGDFDEIMSCNTLCDYNHIPLYCPRNKRNKKRKRKIKLRKINIKN